MATRPQPAVDERVQQHTSAPGRPVIVEAALPGLTPVAAMRALGLDAPCFLLESGASAGAGARWSFVGHAPEAVVEAWPDSGDPLDALRALTSPGPVPDDDLPPFVGGAVGFLAYEAARRYERLPGAPDTLRLPDTWFGVYRDIIAFDHARGRVLLVSRADAEASDPEAEIAARHASLAALEHRLRSARADPAAAVEAHPVDAAAYETHANLSRQDFHAAVDRCREYIVAGDIFQVQVSRRFSVPTTAHPFDVYCALRAINPSPYMFYMATPHATLVGASPEMLVRVRGTRVEHRPIAGTRRRGRTEEGDLRMEGELRSSEKERAEHLMLVDLGRNDIGRVCAAGSVRVSELMSVERYSHVMHLVSAVEGTLADGRTALDALQTCFPAGTVTGAPKIRAMEIIAELEPEVRGVYAGAAGYVGWNGDLDMAITLRTLWMRNGLAHVQAAAGIVADSAAAEEALEIDNKVGAMLAALESASGR